MSWDVVLHKRLRDICAYLWEDSRDCRRLVTEAQIDSRRINWDDPPALRWQSVIMECEKQGTLYKLCPVLLAEYPENTHLIEAVAPWMDLAGGESPEAEAKLKAEEKAAAKAQKQIEPVKKIPVEVPLEYADLAEEIPITLESMRMDMAWMTRQINEYKRWRREVAVLAAKDRVGEEDVDRDVSISLPSKREGAQE